jgi:GNAT superfamily N-acetyltransferase
MIHYLDNSTGITPAQLHGFFVGWRSPRSSEEHLSLLRDSNHVVLAMDDDSGRVVGFITAITDGIQAAFIPMLEVLPEWQGQGIGSELVRRMLDQLRAYPCVDLTCDPHLQPFYERFGMTRSVGMVLRRYVKPSVEFRRLHANEEDAGYQVILDTVAWLRTREIDQWHTPLSREVYANRHERGENFGLFLDGILSGIVSLRIDAPDDWAGDISSPNARYLSTLTTIFHGRGLGQMTVEYALRWLADQGHTMLYLDCAPGFLEQYYTSLGFTRVRQQLRNFLYGVSECVLMKIEIVK